MTIKNIFKIHILYYFVAFFCFITGYFKQFTIFTSIIIIHELGHILASTLFKWKIEKIILLPFGGITIFKECLNKPLYQELLIALMGPIFQSIFLFCFYQNQLFRQINLAILIFNLLPIVPLDGSKIVQVISNYITSFKKSHNITIIISIITIIIFPFIIKLNLYFSIILIFILIEIIKEISRHNYYFEKFLLERYLYEFYFPKEKCIRKINQMKKDTKHLFKIGNFYYTEKEIIRKRFDN